MITFTITSCKRFDLFEKTMNSFLNCCIDIERIDKWLCVDQNTTIDANQNTATQSNKHAWNETKRACSWLLQTWSRIQ